VTHWTQSPVTVLQSGVVPPQLALVSHATHAPVPRLQIGAPAGHWGLLVHGTQAPDALQTGVVPEQSALVKHSTHTPSAVHIVFGDAQSEPNWHSTQAPFTVLQIVSGATLHSLLVVHGPQVPAVVLQTGDVFGQPAFDVHVSGTMRPRSGRGGSAAATRKSAAARRASRVNVLTRLEACTSDGVRPGMRAGYRNQAPRWARSTWRGRTPRAGLPHVQRRESRTRRRTSPAVPTPRRCRARCSPFSC
jgi:hypothetical protein